MVGGTTPLPMPNSAGAGFMGRGLPPFAIPAGITGAPGPVN